VSVKVGPATGEPVIKVVTITGENLHSVTQPTDDAGHVKIVGLTPGKYTVAGTVPVGHTAPDPQQVTVIDRGCAEVEFHSWWDGRIRGHVQDFDGRPIAGVYVSIADASEQGHARIRRLNSAITDKYGAYEIKTVQPGTYLVMVDDRDPHIHATNAIAFYPDATVSNNAKELAIGQATIAWSPPHRAEYSLTENVTSPFQAEPAHLHAPCPTLCI